jgi:hypothetical protein
MTEEGSKRSITAFYRHLPVAWLMSPSRKPSSKVQKFARLSVLTELENGKFFAKRLEENKASTFAFVCGLIFQLKMLAKTLLRKIEEDIYCSDLGKFIG